MLLNTYKEASDQGHSLIATDPNKAIEIIRLISKQNIPVKEEDVFYVRGIAALAASPIFRELEVAKKLLRAIYDVKKDDYGTNSMLFNLALVDENEAEIMEFAKSLIYSDYQSYLKSMEPAKLSSIEDVRNYHEHVVEKYELVGKLFEGVDDVLEKRAKEIVVALKTQARKCPQAPALDIKRKKTILKSYLGASPVWFDLRKKELIKDRIDIDQWRVNMNYRILRCGTIDRREQEALADWVLLIRLIHRKDKEFDYEEYLELKVTPLVKRCESNKADLPPIFWTDQDRNWFLAAYPDVYDFFFPTWDFPTEDFEGEKRRIEGLYKEREPIYEKMVEYVEQRGKYNQTIFLVRMKDYYRNVLNRAFLLTECN